MKIVSMNALQLAAKLSLAFLWIFSGLTSLFFSPEVGYDVLAAANIDGAIADFLIGAGAMVDLALGAWVISGWKLKACCIVQVATIVVYTALLSAIEPSYWLHPFGPLTKNLPILVLILIIFENAKSKHRSDDPI